MKIRQVEFVGRRAINLSAQELIYLRRAWHIARTSTEKQKHGAVLVLGRKTMAVGCNTFRNSPNNVTNPAVESSVHAEDNVLKQLGRERNVNGARVFVVRINNKDELMHSAPCDKCIARLGIYGIKEVIHS